MKYTDLCKNIKQAGLGTNIAIGAGIGVVGGGLASLLPSSADKRKRLRRALMLMGSGAIIGGSAAATLRKVLSKGSIDPGIIKKLPNRVKDQAAAQEFSKRPKPLPGDSQAKFIADWVLGGKPMADKFPAALAWDILQKYGPNHPDNITDQIFDNAVRYLDNYKNKAIEVPQGGKPKK